MATEQRGMTPTRSNPGTDVSGATLKSRHSKSNDTGTRDNNTPDSAEDDDNPLQPDLEQEDEQASPPEQAADGELEEDNYMPLSEDEVSLGDDEFVVPKDPSNKSASSAGLWPRQIA